MPALTSQPNASTFAARSRGGAIARGLRVIVALFGLLAFDRPAMAGAESVVSKEYQLKAAFLYNFTKFVEWPSPHFRDASQPITIGVLGRNPFGDELQKLVAGRTVNGRPIAVRGLISAREAREVDLVFVAADEDEQFAELLAVLAGAQVVTVGESRRCAALGGVITFTMEADKVRFEINQGTAEAAGLKISAQLLKLATVVRQRPAGG